MYLRSTFTSCNHNLTLTLCILTTSLFTLNSSSSDMISSVDNQQTVILSQATFAGGCFWCMEPPFENIDGVVSVISGFSGGKKVNPSYQEVASGKTQHLEVIQISFDPQKVSYEHLLDTYWKQIDPTDAGGSFVDRGGQYSSAIFYHDEQQHQAALASKQRLDTSGIYSKPIVTQILKFTAFYTAEEYHQDYYKKNPVRYKFYRYNSGRDQYLEKIWGDNNESSIMHKLRKIELKQTLTPLQYEVTQEDGTEPAFDNEYWDNKREGIYVDIVSGIPLFSSTTKFQSGTGWPSFTSPINKYAIVEKEDKRLFFATRTEVRGTESDAHLGHVFNDGPEPTGLRYCINSAALRFIPKEDLVREGYEKYLYLFDK